MRIRFIKPHKQYKIGETLEVSPNVAFGLTDSGVAIVDKMLTEYDVKQIHDRAERISKVKHG